MLSQEDKRELLEMAHSALIREDYRKMEQHRHNPFLVNAVVDVDRVIEFLNGFNDFFGHKKRQFSKIIDKDMRL
ncbi:MAG: hypothetical protein A2Y00_08745 [Omnitrophica WOR_2 bacterium GWF2_43_52]|nr:MAG: hypothetical protein A2Y01_04595 [Omnitrophica WOR_2 bacterium GWC2_44_8]OGX21184.1 MAG: hypothetical protein A2Y00_08745 [Omnitrophica WOR_2 bacterium GWF2_43_52]OGX54228.1 MAG: hypothetical protein A2460_01045 [Omnitrophica WOR_2 bacterium RIFOXYC2_FULL_43_9]HAH20366.1 hypothetical protein [Candidatus Omnitrophota bacterium]HBG62861.1 hypothetical protein [Candidatus Omnitrophota bacterium]